jgi:hypothetical protein
MPKSDINVTPFIDVLLVLLIIFIVVAPSAPRALDASLPARAEPLGGPTRASLVLEVRTGDFRLNARPVLTLPELEGQLRAAFEARRDRRCSSGRPPTCATRGSSTRSTRRRARAPRRIGIVSAETDDEAVLRADHQP